MSKHYNGILEPKLSLLEEADEKTFGVPYVVIIWMNFKSRFLDCTTSKVGMGKTRIGFEDSIGSRSHRIRIRIRYFKQRQNVIENSSISNHSVFMIDS